MTKYFIVSVSLITQLFIAYTSGGGILRLFPATHPVLTWVAIIYLSVALSLVFETWRQAFLQEMEDYEKRNRNHVQ